MRGQGSDEGAPHNEAAPEQGHADLQQEESEIFENFKREIVARQQLSFTYKQLFNLINDYVKTSHPEIDVSINKVIDNLVEEKFMNLNRGKLSDFYTLNAQGSPEDDNGESGRRYGI